MRQREGEKVGDEGGAIGRCDGLWDIAMGELHVYDRQRPLAHFRMVLNAPERLRAMLQTENLLLALVGSPRDAFELGRQGGCIYSQAVVLHRIER